MQEKHARDPLWVRGCPRGGENYYPKYEQKTNSIKEDSTVEYNLTDDSINYSKGLRVMQEDCA